MHTIDKILVATDFSGCAMEAARFAADLARHYDASITLVHVESESGCGRDAETLESAARDLERAFGARIDWRLLQGDPFAQIIDLADEGAYGLIVLGKTTKTMRTRAYSITRAVVRNAQCPVMTIHAAEPAAARRSRSSSRA